MAKKYAQNRMSPSAVARWSVPNNLNESSDGADGVDSDDMT